MATAILLVPTSAADITAGGNMYSSSWWQGIDYTVTGTADIGDALQAANDGKYLTSINDPISDVLQACGGPIRFVNTSGIPVGATINHVQLTMKFDATHVDFSVAVPNNLAWIIDSGLGYVITPLVGTDSADFTGSGTYSTAVMTTVPDTVYAWIQADLYANPTFDGVTASGTRGWWYLSGGSGSPPTPAFSIDYIALIVDYTSTPVDVWYFNPYTDHYQYAASDPGAPWTPVSGSMPAPTVTAVHPSSGSIQGGTPVTIIGTYFGD